MYQSLCTRWKSDIEEEIVKLILKNINPQLVSQLRSSRLVDALVHLGQQLEKGKPAAIRIEKKLNGETVQACCC